MALPPTLPCDWISNLLAILLHSWQCSTSCWKVYCSGRGRGRGHWIQETVNFQSPSKEHWGLDKVWNEQQLSLCGFLEAPIVQGCPVWSLGCVRTFLILSVPKCLFWYVQLFFCRCTKTRPKAFNILAAQIRSNFFHKAGSTCQI